jgi:class 3 adenylate cyclase/tetratricopeptide (TPR) repeat protein
MEGTKMKCPKCQFENPEGSKFCGGCGQNFDLTCPECGANNPAENKFCNECGSDLKPVKEVSNQITETINPPVSPSIETIGTDTPSTTGERKHVTVLFSDLTGYTAMSEKLDPEEVKEITSRIFGEISMIVGKYDGFIEKYAGDAVMAIFGVPKAHEDDPIRAVKAAREIHELIDAISPDVESRIGQPISMHTGINTGLVVTGEVNLEKGIHGVAGDTINVASRLSQLAKGGEILVSPDTHRQAENYFIFERLFTHYIGREQELTTLNDCLEEAIAGKGQFITVVGEAGIGKSRLIFEFRHSLDREQITVLEGRCQTYGIDAPYLPMVNALRRGLDLREDESPAQLLEKAVANIKAIDSALKNYIPYYLHLLSIPSDKYSLPENLKGEDLKKALLEALSAIITLNAQHKPMVLILEDWHWADEASDAALKHLVSVIPSYPLMLVVLFRPEYKARLGSPEILTPLVLKPLGLPNTEGIIKSTFNADSLPEGLGEMIHEKTGGNPLFIEEVTNSLIEQEMVLIKNRRAALTQSIEKIQLPGTVQAVISSRFDRLDGKMQETLRLASVIGREFAQRILERVTPNSKELSKPLEELKALEVIQQIRVLPEAEYIFKHVLTQVVVYESLLLKRRKELHGLVGQAIEEFYKDRLEERAGILAYHYGRSEHQDKAVKYALLAGDQAAALYANAEATTYFEQALMKTRSLPASAKTQCWQIDATLKLAAVGITRQDVERDLKNLEEAHALAEKLSDETRLASVLYWLGRIYYVLCNPETAIDYTKQSLEIADRLGDDVLAAPSVNLMGRVYWLMSDFPQASRMMERSVHQMRQLGNKTEESTASGFAGLVLGHLGEFDQALLYADRGIKLAQEIQTPFGESAAFHYRGCIWDQRGEWDQAIADYEKAKGIADEVGDLFRLQQLNMYEGRAYTLNGDPNGGRLFLEEGLALAKQIGTNFGLARLKSFLADCILRLGEIDAPLSLCQEAIGLAEESEEKFTIALAHRTLAEIFFRLKPSEPQKAERAILEAIRIQQESGAKPELARSYLSYAQLLKRSEEKEKAEEYFVKAIGMFKEMGMAWDLVQSEQILRKF